MYKTSEMKKNYFRENYTMLLNYISLYVNMQQPYVDKIKILVENENYIIKDHSEREIFKMSVDDDTLLDVLISIAPKQIEIYNTEKIKNIELLKTVVVIFKEKVLMHSELKASN